MYESVEYMNWASNSPVQLEVCTGLSKCIQQTTIALSQCCAKAHKHTPLSPNHLDSFQQQKAYTVKLRDHFPFCTAFKPSNKRWREHTSWKLASAKHTQTLQRVTVPLCSAHLEFWDKFWVSQDRRNADKLKSSNRGSQRCPGDRSAGCYGKKWREPALCSLNKTRLQWDLFVVRYCLSKTKDRYSFLRCTRKWGDATGLGCNRGNSGWI